MLHPDKPGTAAVAALRAAWVRQNKPTGALWTIEKGASPGALHLNIIHPAGLDRPAGAAGHYREPIRTTPRAVAAYISKPSGYPSPELHPGRIFGRSGPLWQWLIDNPDAPIVQAAAIQHIIAPQRPRIITTTPDTDYTAAAARWLPHFADVLADRAKPAPPPAPPAPPPAPPPHPYERRHALDATPRTAAEAARTSGPHLANLRAILAAKPSKSSDR